MTDQLDPPFQPVRSTVYTSDELFAQFDPDDVQSLTRTADFRSYRYFVMNGRAAPRDPYAGMMEALHDNSIVRAMTGLLATQNKPTAAIMGGTRENRDTKTYADVVTISKRLTEAGFLMASGGGPGAMEATHVGATLRGKSPSDVTDALKILALSPALPDSLEVVASDGTVSQPIVAELHKWVRPAVELKRQVNNPGESLAVPTWYYGHEPLSPFATQIAKYFQNSIREDVLLALATNGIVYAPGRAGTLQEVFQDAAQNYYPKPGETFAPMVFFDEPFWTEKLPVRDVLRALFLKFKKMPEADFNRKVLFTSDIDRAVEFLVNNRPTPEKTIARLDALGFGRVLNEALLGR